jgi:hypothetical protein
MYAPKKRNIGINSPYTKVSIISWETIRKCSAASAELRNACMANTPIKKPIGKTSER